MKQPSPEEVNAALEREAQCARIPTVSFPWPSPQVFPNFKRAHHWRSYRTFEQSERGNGALITCEAIPYTVRHLVQGEGKLRLRIDFYPPDRRKRDDDGCIGAFKHYRDGFADALGVDDARFRCQYEFHEPEKPGRVEVTVLG